MALAILGVAVVTLIQLFSVSLRATKKSADYTGAVIHARSLMEEALSVPELEDIGGTVILDEQYTGVVEAEEIPIPYDLGEGNDAEDEGLRFYRITVTVTWPPSGETRLSATRVLGEDTL